MSYCRHTHTTGPAYTIYITQTHIPAGPPASRCATTYVVLPTHMWQALPTHIAAPAARYMCRQSLPHTAAPAARYICGTADTYSSTCSTLYACRQSLTHIAAPAACYVCVGRACHICSRPCRHTHIAAQHLQLLRELRELCAAPKCMWYCRQVCSRRCRHTYIAQHLELLLELRELSAVPLFLLLAAQHRRLRQYLYSCTRKASKQSTLRSTLCASYSAATASGWCMRPEATSV
jgi:hypothetical protein